MLLLTGQHPTFENLITINYNHLVHLILKNVGAKKN